MVGRFNAKNRSKTFSKRWQLRSRHRFLLKSSPSFLIFRFFFLFNNSFLLFFFQNFPHRLFLQTFLLYNVQTYKRGKYLCYKEWRGGRSEEKFTSLITDISVISWRIRGDTRENSKMAAICVEFFFFLFLLTFNKILYIYIYIFVYLIFNVQSIVSPLLATFN